MKKLLLFLAVLLLVGSVNALTWTPQGYPTQYYSAQDGDYAVLMYSIVGSYTWTVPANATDVEYLVVGGGGGGGPYSGTYSPCRVYGGGGGAGGVLSGTVNVSGNSTLSITVGNGGSLSNSGQNSVFGNLTAIGGGAGGGVNTNGADGGSGGGGSVWYCTPGAYNYSSAGSGTAGQGNDGGVRTEYNTPGGGGGAGGAGGNGVGGSGVSSSISGTATTYAAGGGYGSAAIPFVENSGNGGNCAFSPSQGTTTGGSGVVFLKYNGTAPAPATNTSSDSYNQNLIYTPHICRMYFSDEWGNRLSGLTITATPTGQTSVPASWLNIVLGIPVNASMPSTSLSGTSSTDGSLTFLMVEVMQYNIVISGTSPINNASIYQTVTFYPKDTDYSIKINTGLHTNLQAYPVYSLNATPNANSTQFNLSMNYTGTNTTALTFYVIKNNITVVYSTVLGGGGSASYLANNTRGDTYTYGFNATNNMGENNVVQAWQDITMKGSGALFDFGLDATTRMWIALASIFVFAAFWGTTTIKQGAFLTPFLSAGFWWYCGWLPAEMGTIIFAMSFIGALLYMRGQENKVMES